MQNFTELVEYSKNENGRTKHEMHQIMILNDRISLYVATCLVHTKIRTNENLCLLYHDI